jgi:predicted NBD/HSP70 family sugar kinase/DNA-binding transcriptional ArsR family regulator
MSAQQPNRAVNAGRLGAATRSSVLRELNDQAVLEAIFHEGPITRPELAARTSLSRPAISAVVSRLEQAGLVRANGARDGRRGRKPMAYVVSNRAGFVVGVDIGGANVRVGAANIFGELICDERESTAKDSPRSTSQQITAMVRRVVDDASVKHERPLAIGVSTPGVVDQDSRRVTSLAYNLSPGGDFDPLSAIGDRFGVPVLVENNVNLAAVGERWAGVARGVATFAFISIGAGVGMGVVIDDELVRGAHGAAGEIAYLPSGVNPFDERHRLHGGLEDEIGAAAILEALRGDGDVPASSAEEVFELALEGSQGARSVVDRVAQRIGVAIATVCAVIDPALVVLGGGIGSNPALAAPVRATVAALLPVAVRIETSRLGENAALYGAIAIALRRARGHVFSPALRKTAPTVAGG